MTATTRLVFGAGVAFAYLLGSWPLYILSVVSVLMLFSGAIAVPLSIAVWAAVGVPAVVATLIARRIEPAIRDISIVFIWLLCTISVLVTVLTITGESTPRGLQLLMHPTLALVDVLGDAHKRSSGGGVIAVSAVAGAAAVAATFFRSPATGLHSSRILTGD